VVVESASGSLLIVIPRGWEGPTGRTAVGTWTVGRIAQRKDHPNSTHLQDEKNEYIVGDMRSTRDETAVDTSRQRGVREVRCAESV
jgi:hypothetical protein